MNLSACMFAIGFLFVFIPLNSFGLDDKPQSKDALAVLRKDGVEVRINQVQIQRVGTSVQISKRLEPLVGNQKKYQRTIAISISQSGNGSSTGPTQIRLKNGKSLTPMLNGNQKLMNGVANAKAPEGFDFAEYWFAVPTDVDFSEIFPIAVVHNTTNEKRQNVKLTFTGIEP